MGGFVSVMTPKQSVAVVRLLLLSVLYGRPNRISK